MALASPGGRITQGFGPSSISVEPYAWVSRRDGMTRKAYWAAYPGAVFVRHVHMGVDFGGLDTGRALLAMEAGIVTASHFDKWNGGGNVVEVEIRPGTRYSLNHCEARRVRVGAKVKRGQILATLGCTGTIWTGKEFVRSCLAPHCHVNLTIREKGTDGIRRTLLYDVSDFLRGGPLEDDPRIRPL
jgi:murein DD-endopeptidase MepM/ murein hydrolase activator NlpD